MASHLGTDSPETEQSEIIEFLCRPETHGGQGAVERIDTHISTIILVGDRAYKLKRAVRFDYLDYSTLAQRRKYCRAELDINRRTAPEIYERVTAVTREADGSLALNGSGRPVEYLVVMKRFDQEDLLDRRVARDALDPDLTRRLADHIAAFHDRADQGPTTGGAEIFTLSVAGNNRNIARRAGDVFNPAQATRYCEQLSENAETIAPLLDQRARVGRVRRCHGDLHLRNICLFNGEPTLFDAIDFDDRLNLIDVFYDLAFLVMDLEFRTRRDLANLLLNRYLDLSGDYGGLGALPAFMACRAGTRAHTTASAADSQIDKCVADRLYGDAKRYLELGLEFLRPAPARLIAIGGLSGAGKSVLARTLAPLTGMAPGAIHLRSDVIRKAMHDQPPETPLPPEAYGENISRLVYEKMHDQAGEVLDAGYSLICDATYMDPRDRRAVRRVAEAAGVPFTGLWLDAPADRMADRIQARRQDASDADETVLDSQLKADLGPMTWAFIPAGDDATDTARAARHELNI